MNGGSWRRRSGARRSGPWRPALVCKVGGSLLDAGRAPAALEAVRRAAPPRGVLFVAGGGRAADRLRVLHRRGRLTEEEAHWAAVRVLDGTGLRLAGGCGGGLPVAAAVPPPPPVLPRRGSSGGAGGGASGRPTPAAVLVPHPVLRAEDPLPHGWDVTSDSISAWCAGRAGTSGLLLLKSRPGGPVVRGAEDAADAGLVDRHLPVLLSDAPFSTWVLDGRRPDVLARFLTGDTGAGTELVA